MLPPVSAPGLAPSPTKTASSTATTVIGLESFGSPRIEAGPSGIRPETTRMVEAARRAPLAQRLREDVGREERAHHDDLPVGPPPAFRETPLERQARTAFDPPDMPAEVGTDLPFADRSRAEAGFAEARALTVPNPDPGLDAQE